ncbi:MAG: NAD(P)H-dependent oxidoreductase [Pseudomonadota bacterium]
MTASILVFAGSTRKGSHNVKLAKTLVTGLGNKNADVEYLDLADYPLPVLNEDIDVPENAHALAKKFAAHDGFIIVSPEYNSSLTPLLKNTLDWVSITRAPDGHSYGPYADKFVFLCSASPGSIGGLRGLYHLRSVLMNVGAEILTPQLAVGNAGSAIDDGGSLTDPRHQKMMEKGLNALIHAIECHKAHQAA